MQACFQVSVVEKGPDNESFVTLAAFDLRAQRQKTQVPSPSAQSPMVVAPGTSRDGEAGSEPVRA